MWVSFRSVGTGGVTPSESVVAGVPRARSLEDGGHHGAVSSQALMRPGTEEPEVARQEQMVLDLAGRAHRVVQEACEVVVDVSTATLGEVGWDGDARATGLALQA